MLEKIKALLQQVQSVATDTYNPDTYFNSTDQGKAGFMRSQYVLGALFVKGYDNDSRVNFEIFYKDHQGYQIWIWDFDSEKCQEMNDFNTPYYNTDKVIEFFEKAFAN